MAGVKVLVTTDGSNLSDKAIDTAIDLTKQLGGELIGMTSVVGEVVAEHADAIWKGVLACAVRHDVSFIVMASRGLGSIGSFLLGSETQKVLHQVDRPVLIVR